MSEFDPAAASPSPNNDVPIAGGSSADSAGLIPLKTIDNRFSFDGLDLPGMQNSVQAVIDSIEAQVRASVQSGNLDEVLLRAALFTLAHASARAQEEYELVKDDSLPDVWTGVALSD